MKLPKYKLLSVLSAFKLSVLYQLRLASFLRSYNRAKGCFSVGDRVESIYGDEGAVIMVYRDMHTDEPVGCAVRWDFEMQDGNEISPFLPAANLGKTFNPLIRKIE